MIRLHCGGRSVDITRQEVIMTVDRNLNILSCNYIIYKDYFVLFIYLFYYLYINLSIRFLISFERSVLEQDEFSEVK